MAERTVGRRNLVALGWASSAAMAVLFLVILAVAMFFALARAFGGVDVLSESAMMTSTPASFDILVGIASVAITAAVATYAYRKDAAG